MAKQTIRQRKALAQAQPKKASRSPASKPSAALPSERHYDYAHGYSEGWNARDRTSAADLKMLNDYFNKHPDQLPEPEQEGASEALRERSEPVPSSFRSFIAKWWKR